MSTLSYDKQKLIDQLKTKRRIYLANFEDEKKEAQKGVISEIEATIKKHQKDLELIKAGKDPEQYYNRYYKATKPDTYSFDLAIARLESCIDTTIKLSDKSDDQILRLIA